MPEIIAPPNGARFTHPGFPGMTFEARTTCDIYGQFFGREIRGDGWFGPSLGFYPDEITVIEEEG